MIRNYWSIGPPARSVAISVVVSFFMRIDANLFENVFAITGVQVRLQVCY